MAARSGDVRNLDRKLAKKLARIKDRLSKNESITACDEPSAILCVQNGGLDNGVSQDEVLGLCSQFGSVQDTIMIPQKPYCFVCYDSTASAVTAKDNLTGYLLREGKDPSQNVTLYLFFVNSAPASVCPSTLLPPGLLLFENFITKETEQQLLEIVDFKKPSDEGTGSSLKHREVKHFGYEFKYSTNNVDPSDPLPEGIPELCRQVLQDAVDQKIISHFPDQLTVNRYMPGQGIPSHVDTPSAFEDGILSLSCGSQVIMEFRHPDGQHLSVLVPPRSLLVMTGESRYIWTHGITPRKSDIIPSPAGGITLKTRGTRTSFTFRKLSATAGILPSEQENKFSCKPRTDEEALVLESHHVHAVYEEIADHFSDTRHKPWPQIAEFLSAQPPGAILVDIGCGNGKYFSPTSQLCQIGSDRSERLAGICQSRGFQVFVADVLAIPVRSNSVDVGLCIAVIHHLSTETRRKHAVEELVRILRPGGQVLIYVWAQEQEKDNKKSKYLKPHRQHQHEEGQEDGQQQKGTDGNSSSGGGDLTDGLAFQKLSCCNSESDDGAKHGHETPIDSLRTSLPDSKTLLTEPCAKDDDEGEAHLERVQYCCNDTSRKERSSQVLPVHVNRTEFKDQDMLVPWQLKGKSDRENQAGAGTGARQMFHRFYHVFRQGELDALCAQVSGCTVERSYYDQGNWCVILQKH